MKEVHLEGETAMKDMITLPDMRGDPATMTEVS